MILSLAALGWAVYAKELLSDQSKRIDMMQKEIDEISRGCNKNNNTK